jgi:hypothetical protein
VQKYSERGGFEDTAFLSLGVPAHLAPTLTSASNHGLAATSWKVYSTAERHLQACIEELRRPMAFPFSVGDTLTFVAWLVQTRNIKPKTVQIYLSGLRMCHFRHSVLILGGVVQF